MSEYKTSFAPMLIHKDGAAAIEFYKKAFGAIVSRRFDNPDGTVHVAELAIDGVIFHIREESAEKGHLTPSTAGHVTILIELLVADPVAVQAKAVAAGAKEINPVTYYEETGYKQGSIKDPFGHCWLIHRRMIP
jgi:PhnB protein